MNKDNLHIKVSLTSNPYEIVIGKSSLKCIGNELSKIGFKKGLKVLVVSNHAKYSIAETVAEATNNQTGEKFAYRCETPIEVAWESTPVQEPQEIKGFDLPVATSDTEAQITIVSFSPKSISSTVSIGVYTMLFLFRELVTDAPFKKYATSLLLPPRI